MFRYVLLTLSMCLSTLCFGMEKSLVAEADVQHNGPVSMQEVFEKIIKIVPSRPRRLIMLKHDDIEYAAFMKDIENRFALLPRAEKQEAELQAFCDGEHERYLTLCGALLATLMEKVKTEHKRKQLYDGEFFYYHGKFDFGNHGARVMESKMKNEEVSAVK